MRQALADLLRAFADRMDPPKPGPVWPINVNDVFSSSANCSDVTYTFSFPKGD